jgi:hypothetical protein
MTETTALEGNVTWNVASMLGETSVHVNIGIYLFSFSLFLFGKKTLDGVSWPLLKTDEEKRKERKKRISF